jgi:hypothetical protein
MGKVIGVGGILVEEGALRSLSDAVDAIAHAFGVPRGEELKWSPRGSWIRGNLHGDRSNPGGNDAVSITRKSRRQGVSQWPTES